MLRQLSALLFTLALSISVSADAQTKQQPRSSCEPIGRFLTPQAQTLCKGFKELFRQEVQVFCFSSASVIPVVGGKLAKRCLPPKADCKNSGKTKESCSGEPKYRGERKAGKFNLIRPFGSLITDTNPRFSWSSVPDAKHYQVYVQDASKQVIWAKSTTGTDLTYPSDAPNLEAGATYKVIVKAVTPNPSDIIIDSRAIYILHEEQNQKLNTGIALLDQLTISDDEKALDKAVVFREYGLLDRAYEVIAKRIEAGSQNPAIYISLGDQYFAEGLLDEAKSQFTQAQEFAKSQGNQESLLLADKRLKQIDSTAMTEPSFKAN